jgi:uncharacterized protein (UPF0147 family)
MNTNLKNLRPFQDELIKFYEDIRGDMQLPYNIRMSANKILGGLYRIQQDIIEIEIKELQ